jgi:hypothetical protein
MARFPVVSSPLLRAVHAVELPVLFGNYNPGLFTATPPTELELTAST